MGLDFDTGALGIYSTLEIVKYLDVLIIYRENICFLL